MLRSFMSWALGSVLVFILPAAVFAQEVYSREAQLLRTFQDICVASDARRGEALAIADAVGMTVIPSSDLPENSPLGSEGRVSLSDLGHLLVLSDLSSDTEYPDLIPTFCSVSADDVNYDIFVDSVTDWLGGGGANVQDNSNTMFAYQIIENRPEQIDTGMPLDQVDHLLRQGHLRSVGIQRRDENVKITLLNAVLRSSGN